MTLEQLGIMERLDAARAACHDVQRMIGDAPATDWSTGRAEGRADSNAHAAWVAITNLRSVLTICFGWQEPVYGSDEGGPRLRAVVKPEPPETVA